MNLKRALGDSVSSLALAIGGLGLPISLAALLFSGPLEDGLGRATSSFIIGSALLAGWIAWKSGAVPAFASVQDAPAVIMVPVAASVAASSGSSTDVLVLLAFAGLVTGVVMVVAGRLHLGIAVRYLPTTVVGAFMAGTGWFLAKGGVSVMVGRDVGLADVPDLFDGLLKFCLPGVLLALVIVTAGRASRLAPEVPSVAILVAAACFYAWTFATSSVASRDADGWLIGPFPTGTSVEPLRPSELAAFDPGLIVENIVALVTVVGVAVIALLLNVSGIEFVDGKPLDQNRELQLTGVGNLLMAPFGALVGYVALGSSLLARQLGAKTRSLPLIAAGITAAVGILGPQYVGFVPRFIAGGLLVAVGIDLMLERIVQLKNSAQWTDRILTLVIVAAMATIGIIEGLAVGVVIACAIFVVRYSHIDPIRRETSGFYTSQVDRTHAEAAVLEAHADESTVFELQGYLFFGSAVGLADRVRARCAEDQVGAIVLDYRRVTGVDSSGFAVLDRIGSDVDIAGGQLVLAGMLPTLETELRRSYPDLMHAAVVRPDLDQALEWVETETLGRHASEVVEMEATAAPPQLSESLSSHFSARTISSGQTLLKQDDPGNTLLFVVSGSLVAVRVGPDGSRQRLRQFGANNWIGEVAFFAGGTRTADVVALVDVEVLELSFTDYEQLREAHPEVALELHDMVIAAQATRNTALSIDLTKSLS